jgi:hypothetical protein
MICEECRLDVSLCDCNDSLIKILWEIILIPLIVLGLSAIVIGILFIKLK